MSIRKRALTDDQQIRRILFWYAVIAASVMALFALLTWLAPRGHI